ncbi:hypothetical protein GN956_G5806 [Arapaima gigas]
MDIPDFKPASVSRDLSQTRLHNFVISTEAEQCQLYRQVGKKSTKGEMGTASPWNEPGSAVPGELISYLPAVQHKCRLTLLILHLSAVNHSLPPTDSFCR